MSINVFQEFESSTEQSNFEEVYTHDTKLPYIVVGSLIRSITGEYAFDLVNQKIIDKKKWFVFLHKCRGIACHNIYIFGKAYKLSERGYDLYTDLDRKWGASDVGVFGASLKNLNLYEKDLNQYSLTCNSSYKDFQEACYPFDYDIDQLNNLVRGEIERDLNSLVKWQGKFSSLVGSMGRWRSWLLTENSD